MASRSNSCRHWPRWWELSILAIVGAGSTLVSAGCIRLKNPPDAPTLKTESMAKVVVPEKWAGGGADGEVVNNWLTSFHDDQLTAAVAEAIANNPDLRVGAARVETAMMYAKLAGAEVARLDRIERYAYDELGTSGAPDRPPEMQPGDLLARVPIATPRIGAEPLFGDVVVLLLRREDGRFKIAGVAEENGR